MKVLERKDSWFLEITRALLQLMRMLNEEEISEVLAVRLKRFLDDFLIKANFLSHLKRKYAKHMFANPECRKVIEILCGKNYSEDISEVASIGKDNISLYRKIEKFRDLRRWEKILFENLNTRKTVDFLFGPSIMVIIIDGKMHVIKTNAEICDLFPPMGFGEADHFFRLYQEDRKLIIHYAHDCNIDMQMGCCVAGVTLADFQ
ncbi:MAG: hypothetical protein US57_C0002G0004 [Candidatus Moranbacteria bacterium GW2011_GWC2_37_73]|nr:MAG: hypothetical protein UR95_C0002G0102 [Parcubacteria group bacterium GW2011_GWC1_36_108]KKQ01055.1 MAG: hypothetical protein US09_C0003G0055 [Candidatus Moranbacteria bacterium GW2011_GWD1_36_198]KKQ02457.1 MAG: hypothetical protein US10_C0001G0055 [Candidatus Moranbacteria bacterium GW2011_GWD2_36_198]KKQ40297.1 MAG: hypothetical protein US57_C0002G0004 [Candidatus Moranbacteria bacterium GW2011_GWC2_37_73]HAS00264.1 hypothetical protein [Candidatus Moranbacteria bacterium]